MIKVLFLISIAFLIFSSSGAQITLEHEYASVMLVRLNEQDYRYQYNDTANVYLHDLEHNLVKTIPFLKRKAGDKVYSINLSTSLFNDDEQIECSCIYYNPKDGYRYVVFSEDGTILLEVPNGGFSEFHNTPKGAKILVQLLSTDGRFLNIQVYSVPGHNYPLSIKNLDESIVTKPFPNPASTVINLTYHLPAGINTGTLSIFDMKGNLVKTINVNNVGVSTIDVSRLANGVYLYKINESNSLQSGKLFIIER